MLNYPALAEDVNQASAALTAAAPDAMKGFKALGREAYADRALTRRTKELIALALSIASRCEGCVAYHARRAAELGCSREEVVETIAVAVQMGGGPSMVFGGHALAAFDTFEHLRIAAE